MSTVQISQREENQNDVDALPHEHRLIVHEFGFAIYRALVRAGIRRPGAMRNLVMEIWRGARGSARASKPRGFAGATNLAHLDWLLIQSGSNVSAATLVRTLRESGLVIVPMEPSNQMVEASMATVTGNDILVSKHRKHAMRLKAGIDAAVEHYWPFLKAVP